MKKFQICIADDYLRKCINVGIDTSQEHHFYNLGFCLYMSSNEQAMITITGFDYASFAMLENLFSPYFQHYSPYARDGVIRRINSCISGGQLRMINARSCLALVLCWYQFSGPNFIVQGWFGFTGSPLSIWLHFGCHVLLHILSYEDCAVRWPLEDRIVQYKAMIAWLYPNLLHVCCM